MVSEMYPGQVPSHRVRVTDDERRQAVERLCRAQAAGCLALDEFDERPPPRGRPAPEGTSPP